jgi:hypothetical protein
MAAQDVGAKFFKGETGRNTRGLLRLIILVTIAAAAISSRLFSVIRFESIIHECKKNLLPKQMYNKNKNNNSKNKKRGIR